jgi:hypothetical protein
MSGDGWPKEDFVFHFSELIGAPSPDRTDVGMRYFVLDIASVLAANAKPRKKVRMIRAKYRMFS